MRSRKRGRELGDATPPATRRRGGESRKRGRGGGEESPPPATRQRREAEQAIVECSSPCLSEFSRYDEDVWTEVANYLDGQSLIQLASVNRWFHNQMKECIWRYACLRDLQVPRRDLYSSAIDGRHSYCCLLLEKHIGATDLQPQPDNICNLTALRTFNLTDIGGTSQLCLLSSKIPQVAQPQSPFNFGLSLYGYSGRTQTFTFGSLLAVVIAVIMYWRKRGTGLLQAKAMAMVRALRLPSRAAACFEVGNQKNLVFFRQRDRIFDMRDLDNAELLQKGMYGKTFKTKLRSRLCFRKKKHIVIKTLKMVAKKKTKKEKPINFILPVTEFRKRIEAIGAAFHDNVLSLKAYLFFEEDVKLLFYDHMPKGSLSDLLHGAPRSEPLDWERRYSIALAAARGIRHIHSMGPRSCHGNIKSSNILLQEEPLYACVSEHGLFHLLADVSTCTPVPGYSAPEREISQEADVYSFGVILQELLTDKPPRDAIPDRKGYSPQRVEAYSNALRRSEVFDPELSNYQYAAHQMSRLLDISTNCLDQNPCKRPSMAQVVDRIERIKVGTASTSRE